MRDLRVSRPFPQTIRDESKRGLSGKACLVCPGLGVQTSSYLLNLSGESTCASCPHLTATRPSRNVGQSAHQKTAYKIVAILVMALGTNDFQTLSQSSGKSTDSVSELGGSETHGSLRLFTGMQSQRAWFARLLTLFWQPTAHPKSQHNVRLFPLVDPEVKKVAMYLNERKKNDF